MPTAKSKPPHPMSGNHEFYFCNIRYIFPYCLSCLLVCGDKIREKGIECNLTDLAFCIILTILFAYHAVNQTIYQKHNPHMSIPVKRKGSLRHNRFP